MTGRANAINVLTEELLTEVPDIGKVAHALNNIFRPYGRVLTVTWLPQHKDTLAPYTTKSEILRLLDEARTRAEELLPAL